ncbi:hypothetical protein COU76_04670 [Candidatus Peregrinibacteria bacterium CG10_big_fil_rev_8_21_14_0_10_49_10]|nr:MAG: hypothetical protein COU76_04670 [Candidatus Peregrinibacteria bacterium CG10_big_fil_rev_8_21_14_0_10_49_10]
MNVVFSIVHKSIAMPEFTAEVRESSEPGKGQRYFILMPGLTREQAEYVVAHQYYPGSIQTMLPKIRERHMIENIGGIWALRTSYTEGADQLRLRKSVDRLCSLATTVKETWDSIKMLFEGGSEQRE